MKNNGETRSLKRRPSLQKEKDLLIVALAPDFAERDVFWFSENENKIKNLLKTDSFWQNHAVFIEKDEVIKLSEFLRKLDDLNYEKVMTLSKPGEFSSFGGTVTIFPINSNNAFKIEFFGNKVENISKLENITVDEKEKSKILKKQILSSGIHQLKNLKPEDYIVHIDHGIGVYKGEVELAVEDDTEENTLSVPNAQSLSVRDAQYVFVKKYYLLEYAPPKDGAEHDKLYVPEDKANKLSLYLGFTKPAIHRLSGNAWVLTVKKATEDAEKFAKELLELYAKRSLATRTPYQKENSTQREFKEEFEHIETKDQEKAVFEIEKDMESEIPMDRLLCGDVGFGKTEVAMRAAFKAISSGKQVAILCPTTILSDQHFENFKNRFKKFPINIAMLNRFEALHDQKETLKKLRDGKVDILIGTHRIISNDVFPAEGGNLGLLIIDEEQRFGVKQKEKLKKLRETLDILSLSATPIPRTLYLAMSGIRQISLISTPPFGRMPIETISIPYQENIIKEAIEKEIKRKGQVYFLHNRIETINKTLSNLKKILPDARYCIAHGRLSEKILRSVMHKFKNNEYDVLVATTIIENGLDIKNVNTLIVDDATKLGLSQAHQIRGRIGRHTKKAHAYFMYNEKSLTEDGKKRLEALEQFSDIGSGYQIAAKDLEIRGAGDILGKKQSGTINQIGLNLYCEILNQAIESLEG